jgi:hypothetical protein
VEQMGLADPRDYPPVVDGWDGLSSFREALKRMARSAEKT